MGKKQKECPFCGANVMVVRAPMMDTVAFICRNCGADVMFFGAERDKDKAIEAWNRRVVNDG